MRMTCPPAPPSAALALTRSQHANHKTARQKWNWETLYPSSRMPETELLELVKWLKIYWPKQQVWAFSIIPLKLPNELQSHKFDLSPSHSPLTSYKRLSGGQMLLSYVSLHHRQ